MLAFLMGTLAFFQALSFDIDFYNTQQGLSNNIVYDVHQDQQGFIWVATENGLNRFDAYEFRTFYHTDTDPNSISSNVVRSIFESTDGRLWIGTRKGLNVFDKKTETFTRFNAHDSLNLSSNDILNLVPDSEENLWYLSQSRLIYFDTRKKVYGEVEIPFLIYNIVIDIEDNIWMTGYEGELYLYSIRTKELQKVLQIDTQENISFFLAQDKRTILYNTFGAKIILHNWKAIPPLNGKDKTERLYIDSKGRSWFSSKEDLYVLEEGMKNSLKVNLSESSEPILSTIKAITEDKSGGIWVGTVDGLYRIKSKEKNFQKIQGEAAAQAVMAIEETENTWWINYFSRGLARYEFSSSGVEEGNSFIDLERGLNQIWDIQKIDETTLWLATQEGIFELDETSLQVSKIEVFEEEREHEVFFKIKKDKENEYWIGGYGTIIKLDARTKEVLKRIEILNEYEGTLIQDLISYRGGLLIATEIHGVFHYSDDFGLSKRVGDKSIPSQLDQTSVWDIFQANDQTIWFGGNDGLFSISSYEEFSSPVKAKIGENIIVFSITEDRNQQLWLGTDKGLINYNPKNKEFRIFDSGDGFENPEFNRRSVFTSKSGEIVVGGMSGFVYFDPNEIKINQNEPDVWLTGFRVITPDSIKKLATHQVKETNLTWQENTFEIDFTALNYDNPIQNQYKYKLENYDPDWVSTNKSRIARYVKVPAGEYEFKVIASNNDGIWNETGDSIQIKISPPFWDTYWFRLLILALFLIVVWTLYRFRVRQLLEVERVRLRIAGDLHDEIGSGLSGIALTGDLLQNQVKEGTPKPEMIQKISGNARSLASSLDSIVWLIDPNKESLLDLIIKCKRVAMDLLPKHELIFEDEIPENFHKKELSSELRRGFYLIFKEAVHNIHKHAQAQKVAIRFNFQSGKLMISVKDNGIGFVEENILKGNGIDGLRKRAEEMGGIFTLESEEGKGTTIIIQSELP